MYKFLTEDQKHAITAVLQIRGYDDSREHAIARAEKAIAKRVESAQPTQMLDDLEGLGMLECAIRTADKEVMASWRPTQECERQMRAEASAWLESEIRTCGIDPASLYGFEESRDVLSIFPLSVVDLARIAEGDVDHRRWLLGEVRQLARR
jgi:hypothetical protein